MTTLTGVTGANGVVSLGYKLQRNAAAGTYQVNATISITAANASLGASTVFQVQ
jgi:uncharacterized protein YfaS (alpha-2-macroglobulin family)